MQVSDEGTFRGDEGAIERQYEQHRNKHYERLAKISVTHLYNL